MRFYAPIHETEEYKHSEKSYEEFLSVEID